MQHQVQATVMDSIGHMSQYGIEHWSFLALTLVCILIAVPLIRRHPQLLKPAGWVFLTMTVFWAAWGVLPGNFTLDQSLPFHFSDVLRVITAIALITRARWAVSLTIFWGLTLNLMSLLSPDLNYYTVPWMEAFFYWFLHIVVLVAAVVFIFSLGYKPGAVDLAVTIFITIAWGILCLLVNQITGANYGYLSHEPAVDSILDHLGGWPFYIVAELFLLGIAWVLLTLAIRKLTLPYTSNTRNVMANSTDGSSSSSAP